MSLLASFSIFSQSLTLHMGTAIFALLCAVVTLLVLTSKQKGLEKMEWAALSLRETATRFLRSVWTGILLAGVVIAFILYIFIDAGPGNLGAGQWALPFVSGSFIVGVLVCIVTLALGLRLALAAQSRTAQAARTSLAQALKLSFLSAASVAWLTSGLGLLVFGGALLHLLEGHDLGMAEALHGLLGLALGSAFVSFIVRMTGGLAVQMLLPGVHQKSVTHDSSHLAADLDGAVLGLVARSADVLDLLWSSMLAVMILALSTNFGLVGKEGSLLFPIVFVSFSILSALPFGLFIRAKKGTDQVREGFRDALFWEMIVLIIIVFIATRTLFAVEDASGVFVAALGGILLRMMLMITAEQSLTEESAPLARLSLVTRRSPVDLFLQGLSFGHVGIVLPVLMAVCVMIVVAMGAGLYGLGIAALGCAGTSFTLSILHLFNPVVCAARSTVERSELPKQVTSRMEVLSVAGRELSVIAKTVTVFASFLTALALFFAFTQQSAFRSADLGDPLVLAGLLIGSMLPLLIAGLTLAALLRSREDLEHLQSAHGHPMLTGKGLLLKTVSAKSLRETLSLIAVLFTPIITGVILGVEGLGGLLAGALVSGTILSVLLLYAGSAWNGTYGTHGMSSDMTEHLSVARAIARIARDLTSPVMLQFVRLLLLVSLVTSGLYVVRGVF